MKNLIKYGLLIVSFLFITKVSFAHGGGHSEKVELSDEYKDVKEPLSSFDTLHPLVVHFPIVLLLFALLSHIASMFVFKNELSWVTMVLLFFGFVGAYIAGNIVHPHTPNLTENAQRVLLEHEEYAEYSVILSLIALVLKAISHFFLKRLIWIEIAVGVLLVGSAYTISTAGHYGAQLTHIEKVEVEK